MNNFINGDMTDDEMNNFINGDVFDGDEQFIRGKNLLLWLSKPVLQFYLINLKLNKTLSFIVVIG